MIQLALVGFGYAIFFLGILNLVRMFLFLIGAEIYDLKQDLKRSRLKRDYRPTVCVIIPAHNEAKVIKRTLTSVLASKYTHYNVIVVDDGSTDGTAKEVRKFIKNNNCKEKVRLIRKQNGGKASALNHVLEEHAKATLIMCLDADSMIAPEAIGNAANHFTDERLVALASNVRIIDDGTVLGLVQKFEYVLSYRMKKALTSYNIEYIIGGIGSVFRRSALESVGYYDTNTITEDIDLTFKLIKDGNKANRVAYGADVIAYTESVPSFNSLVKQRYRWKYGRFQTFYKNWRLFFNARKKHNRLLTILYLPFALFGELTYLVEPLLVSYILFVSIWYGDAFTLLSAFVVLTAYITLNILLDENLKLKEKLSMILYTPAVYPLTYVLSLVEYIALWQSLKRITELKQSISKNDVSWDHVERSGVEA